MIILWKIIENIIMIGELNSRGKKKWAKLNILVRFSHILYVIERLCYMKYLVNMDIWRIYSCLRRFALVQFQHVRHAILLYLDIMALEFMKIVVWISCVMDIRLTDLITDLSLSYKCSTILRVLLIPCILQNKIQPITRNY